MFRHNSAGAKRDGRPTFVVAITTSAAPSVAEPTAGNIHSLIHSSRGVRSGGGGVPPPPPERTHDPERSFEESTWPHP